ncbi:C-type lectin domain family 2 member E [Lonchura striata]|uniref:C-type lectin domain family 2 member E n=1 Tax=Lonchura striata TaxID=40157 RepID=A0A218V9L4_9PASE|nr:C-type lectin domain family 2 member E [Lonchura striata domestica]
MERNKRAGHSMEMKPEARVTCQVMLAVLFTALFITAITFAGECQGFNLTGNVSERGKETVLLVNIVLFLMTVQAFQPHPQPCFQCPFDWIRYRGKCYYFSEVEGNWTSSQDNCSALDASLAMLDSMEDLSFIMRYKGISEHWIGLLREDEEQPWQWVNRSPLSHLFRIHGSGLCAYLDDNGLSSSQCSTERSWICNKHELQSSGKGNRLRRPPNLCVSSLGAAGRPSHAQISGAP